jgi:hypothetical protein
MGVDIRLKEDELKTLAESASKGKKGSFLFTNSLGAAGP